MKCLWWLNTAAAQPMARLRVGVIARGMGRGHILGWRGHPQVGGVARCSTQRCLVGADRRRVRRHRALRTSRAMLAAEALDVMSMCASIGRICRSLWLLKMLGVMRVARSRWP